MAEPLRCDIPAQADHAQLYELLVSELTDFAVFLTDPTGCITSWNPGVERILGYTETEWLGQSAHIIFTPEDRAARKPEEEMATAARDRRAPDIRWHQRKDGSRFFVEGTMVALKDSRGELLGFSKVMRDITQRKQAEEALRASLDKSVQLEADRDKLLRTFDTVLAELQEFVYLFDLEGRFRYVNQPLLDLWGLTQEQVVGKSFSELGYPDELVRLHEGQIRRVIETAKPVEGENAYTSPAGVTGYYEYTFVPLLAPDGTVESIGGHTRDTTERRRAEEQLRRATDRLEAAHTAAELGMWSWDVQADHLIADRNLAFFFGIDERAAAEGMSAEPYILRVHPDDQPSCGRGSQTR